MPDENNSLKNYSKTNYERLLTDMDKTAKLLVKRDLELNKANDELDEKSSQLKEDEKRVKELNEVLEIRL
jgi:hypothetical protein